jgi:YteA family regulatory protein
MEDGKLLHYKRKLIDEKKKIVNLMNLMIKNETIDSKSEMASELSFYDNHPADLATEISDIERGMALRNNELSIISKIDNALEAIEKGSYGICKCCGKVINENRLEFIPYAECCTKCQNEKNQIRPREKHDRPSEEDVITNIYNKNEHNYRGSVQFDGEDSYQRVEMFNERPNIEEFYEDERDNDYVDPIERISNEQYKNQLPD